MLYTNTTHQMLLEKMDQHYRDLDAAIDRFRTATEDLVAKGWEGNDAAVRFKEKANSLLDPGGDGLGDTHDKLEKLRDAIDIAFGNAKAADQKVYNSF